MNRPLLPAIPTLSEQASEQAQKAIDHKTKPRGSLGRLEALAVKLAAIRGTADLVIPRKTVVVMAGDHGVANRGVSAYPQEVSAQMLLNFAAGGAAVNVLARGAGAEVVAVDMGVVTPVDHADIRSARVGPGTKDLVEQPAMTQEQAEQAVIYGVRLAETLVENGTSLIALGEMGIGNSTSASALTSVFTGAPALQVTGRGTGIDVAGVKRKVAAIQAGLRRSGAAPDDPWKALRELGGFEIAGLVGVALGAASRRIPVVLDGFITGAAALTAAAIDPTVCSYFIAGHCSAEPGHRIALNRLELEPLLELNLRLGEGSGAALAFPIIDAAIRVLGEMATFSTANVTDTGA